MVASASGDPPGAPAALSSADKALDALVIELEAVVARLQSLLDRAVELRARRRQGIPWHELVTAEQRPLIVEVLSDVLDDLGDSGGRFRRAEAQALAASGLSHVSIARLFGVSRQRVGALLAPAPDPDARASRRPSR